MPAVDRGSTPNGPAPAVRFVDALRREQQRVLHHCTILDYVLAAEKRGGAPLPLGDALAEILNDISAAAHTIGLLLPTTNGRP